MPELYEFLLNRLALYHNLQYDLQDDKEPELLFYNLKDEVVQRYLVRDMTADQLSALLESLGFYKKSAKGEEVPKEFQHFPLKAPRDEL
ncbi:selenoprotein e [Chiloscyllium plagiosum]|uniref:selenoprotein e n=1 Tax=Chiloscyllium plagiosum TaxID=36176 RepID=UPI001CB82B2C|nr:selenoprotein e [Chiloscyllium plagiosum]